MSIIVPKKRLHPDFADLPIIFLIGPDFGGGGWQDVMYDRIVHHAGERKLGRFVVAIPRRYAPDDPMLRHEIRGCTDGYEHQLDWERDLIRRAALEAKRGCVAAWLPEESKTAPRTDGEPYARDTRGEIGEIRGWMAFRPDTRFVLGAEPGFPGLNVIKRNFAHVCGGGFTVYDTIDDLARCAVRIAKRPH